MKPLKDWTDKELEDAMKIPLGPIRSAIARELERRNPSLIGKVDLERSKRLRMEKVWREQK